MEFLLSFTTATIAATFAFLFFLYHLLWTRKFSKTITVQSIRRPPEAASAWPVIGHLHLLGGSQVPHIALGSMADKYGPIFTIKLGVHQALVVSDWKMAKECLTTNDKVFANRPKSKAVELMGYDYALFGLAPYGPYWSQVRKTVSLEFLSNRRIEMVGHIRVSEVKASIKDIYGFWVKNKNASGMVKVEMKELFGSLILNMAVQMVVGKRYLADEEEGVRFQKAVRKFFELLGTFVLSDWIPFLWWWDFGGYEKEMKKTAEEMDYILDGWLEEHKRKKEGNSGKVKYCEQQDFMDVMLSIVETAPPEDLSLFDADTVIKATCLGVLSGATDTLTVTLTWALSLLLNNCHELKKAQDELDIHVGRDRLVEESDMKNLVYMQAILKETLRLYPAAPLSVPHESMEDCVVGGYDIPKGTRLLVNIWKIHHDPLIWSDPLEFRPERFLTSHKDIDIRGQHFELIPFSSGRRMCPGINFGLQVVQFTLASLIHGFEFLKPSDEAIDMSESIGQNDLKATPLEVFLKPRLSPNLYEQIVE